VELKRILPIVVALAIGGMIASCKLDPWETDVFPTDVVTITKTTKIFDTQKQTAQVYKSQVGSVKFSHKVHEKQGLKCIDCHHKQGNPEREKACAKCHNGDNGYKTMHGLCINCHIERKSGPQKCKQCH
jgi:formate-dependent nitrite reductase cytochrome c552 subunit